MPNPASAFANPILNPFLGQMAQSSLPPMSQSAAELDDVVPAQRLPETSALQDQVIQHILSTLPEPIPKRTWKDRLTTPGIMVGAPTRKEREWQMRQEQASRSIQALNAMTGMGRLAQGEERLGLQYDSNRMRQRMLDIAQDREKRLGYGPAVRIETTDQAGNPMILAGNQMPGGQGIILTDGQVIHPSAFPKGIRMDYVTTSEGGRWGNPYTGDLGPVVAQSPAPPGAETGYETGLTVMSMLDQLEPAFSAYADSSNTLDRYGHQVMIGPILGKPQEWALGSGAAVQNLARINPQAAQVSNIIGNLSDIIVRLRSGAQINEAEASRLLSLLPKLVSEKGFAQQQMQLFRGEFQTRMRAKAAAFPQLFTEQKLSEQGLSRAMLGLAADASTIAPSGDSLDSEFDSWRQQNAPHR